MFGVRHHDASYIHNLKFDSGNSSGDANGAQAVERIRYPYLVSLRDPIALGNPHYCNGILVGEKEVLTAAHCVDPKLGGHLLPFIYVGQECSLCKDGICRECTDDPMFVDVSDVRVEPTWESNVLLGGDIALLILDEHVKGVPFATISLEADAVRLFGFNFLHSFTFVDGKDDSVNEVQILAREGALCQQLYLDSNIDIEILPGMLCASAVGSEVCTGFSGAPLIIKGENPDEDLVVGLLSFGTEGCRLPAIYTDIYVYAKDLIGELSQSLDQEAEDSYPQSLEANSPSKEIEEGRHRQEVRASNMAGKN